ncbi:hypothetical protein [Bythopirellula polymerisocia]|uniref:Lipocalin-like domain-containing protein n=1 Tax=Bythopirellula polymerisocia TaxID=2528003 RepID=A0A5C6CXS5_9BACT|nr:hypothetical protein [Bythopirellula polymerisocia]TWU27439.1 hypothetical protein Pla144_22120 [Bythopirellula polymerisocia]
MLLSQHCRYSCFLKSILLILLLSSAGCQQQIAGELLGSWVGRPDTSTGRAEREAEKYGKRSSMSADSQQKASAKDVTDWETYDVEVRFNFVDHKHLEMSLANGSEAISATWRVIETSPTGCMIEVVTPAEAEEGSPEVRNFELEMDERAGTIVGFLLTESGADRQLGALYFSRAP